MVKLLHVKRCEDRVIVVFDVPQISITEKEQKEILEQLKFKTEKKITEKK